MKKQKTMAAKMNEYISYRRNLGYKKFGTTEELFLNFAKYADSSGHKGPVTIELILRWASLPKKLSPSYYTSRMGAIKGFAKYLSAFEPQTEIPPVRTLRNCA